MENLISVIVLVYKVEQYLEQCIQSIINQTYKNLEIIIVCKDSDDSCAQICDEYARIDARIIVIHQEDSGVDAARKAGIKHAKGKYLGYVDGDDWIEPRMYEKLLDYAISYNVEVVESGVIDTWENAERKRGICFAEGCYKGEAFEKNIEPRLLYSGNFFEHGVSGYMWSKLFLKSSIEKYQMMTGMLNENIDDIMVSLPCIAQTRSIYITHDYYYHYRLHPNNGKCAVKRDKGLKFAQYYTDIFKRFAGTQLCRKGDLQILSFIMYRLLLKGPEMFDSPDEKIFLRPFGGIERKSRIVLYGAGVCGRYLEQYAREVQECELICWVDKNYASIKGQQNICDPRRIKELDFDYIVVSIMRAYAVNEVKKYLNELGVDSDKVLWIEQKYIEDPLLLLKSVSYNGKHIFEGLEDYYI